MASSLEDHLSAQLERSREFFWHRLRWRVLLDHLPAGRPFQLVDIGAGAGLLGDFLARRLPDCRYGFVEPIVSLETDLEARFGEAANFRSRDSFRGVDVVTLMDVIEHLAEDRAFLARTLERMDPGARLVVTVPALRSLWSGWDVALGHYRRYDKRMLREAVEGLPARFLELSYLHPEMVPLGWARKLRRPVEGASAESDSAQFPDLPRWANDLLYGVGLVPLRLRRWSPLGTSVLAVLVRT